ncbi:glutathione S-transferase family protein [Gammaproteobacteria bacterium]|nr:glutathione S-transferase family protein [Gammaproteobacteria bacterium]
MKLYNSMGPNPHIVRMFAAELDMPLELVEIDLRAGENRQPEYLARNPAGQLPALELDSGEIIAEVTAICEYLDELSPMTLLGDTPTERAQTRMWTRRLDLSICEPMLNGFRYAEGLPIFQDRMITIPEAAPGLKRIAQNRLNWLDEQMADRREFVTGSRFTLADVFLHCMLTFGNRIGQPISQEHTRVAAWYERIAARPSAAA